MLHIPETAMEAVFCTLAKCRQTLPLSLRVLPVSVRAYICAAESNFCAVIFVVVNGVPSIGIQVMVGSGQIGTQPIQTIASLPSLSMPQGSGSGSNGSNSSMGHINVAQWRLLEWVALLGALVALLA
jgi:hypothetical protein